jgi:hypothetical protein
VVVLGPTPTSINDALTSGSCKRYLADQEILVPVNLYSVSGTPGTAIKIDVSAPADSIAPYVLLSDADGQFGDQESGPPIEMPTATPTAGATQEVFIEFYVTTSKPYEFLVTSSSATVEGSYTLTVSSRPCPTPVPLALPASKAANLDGTECPDPEYPSTGDYPNPADIYSFTVTQVPTNVSITMQQISATDTLYATLSMRSPNLVTGGSWYNGLELVSYDITTDCSSDTLTCAQIQFLALQAGTYTIVASGEGGTGKYTLFLSKAPNGSCSAKALTNIPANAPLQCNPGHAGSCACSQQTDANPGASLYCGGILTSNTSCAAPLQIPGISDGEPSDVASPADLYTFSANAGDVISVLMNSDDDAHLYLLGPAPGVTPAPGATPPNVLIAQDDDSGTEDDIHDPNAGYGDSELAATLVQSGTYTIVAANNEQVDPDFGPVNYTLYIQKCPANTFSGQVSDTFSGSECVGYGGIPFRSYSYATGQAGQFLSANMTSDTVDAFVRILGPNGSQVANDTDPFATDITSTDARASRILQQNGIYYVEVSTNLDAGEVDPTTSPPPGFTLTTTTCPTKPAASVMNGTFGSSSCVLSTGQLFDVYSFTPPSIPSVASVSPPSNGCVLNLMAEGPQTPDDGCNSATSDMPLMSAGAYYGFIIAANDPGVTGAYTARFSQGCALGSASFGDVVTGTLSGGGCTSADGVPAQWYLVHGPADVVQLNAPMLGTVAADFAFIGALTDISGTSTFTTDIIEDFTEDLSPPMPYPFFQFPLPPSTAPPPPFGGDIGFLVRIAGATPSDVGSYTLEIDPAFYSYY